MLTNNYLKQILIIGAILCLGPFVYANENENNISAKLTRAIEQKLLRVTRPAIVQYAEFPMIQTCWEVVRTKTFSRRKVSVRAVWGKPEQVKTVCPGIEREGHLYVAASCYYPAQQVNQDIRWLQTHLLSEARRIALTQPKITEAGWVVFDLPERS